MQIRCLPLLGIFLFAYIISRVNPGDVIGILSAAELRYLFFATLVLPIPILLQSIRWNAIMGSCNIHYPLGKTMKIWLIGMFAGSITPGRVGEFSKAYYLKMDGFTTEESITSIILDRVVEVLTLITIGILGAFYLSFSFKLELKVFLAVFVVVLFMIFILLEKRTVSIFIRPIFRRFAPKEKREAIKMSYDEFYSKTGSIKGNKGLFLLTLSAWLLSAFSWYLLAQALNFEIPYLYLVAVMPITVFATSLPVSIFGLGTREAVFIFLFAPVGLNAQEAVSFAILALAFLLIPPSSGFLLWMRENAAAQS
jgi:hypothetical protein